MIGKILRWMLVPVAAAAVLALAVVGSRWAVSIVDGRCPVERMVGGACVEPWHTGAVEAAIYGGVAFAGFGLVLFPALIAPNLKRTVAAAGLLLGVGAAGGFYLMTGWGVLLAPLAVAAVSGGLALWLTWMRRTNHEAR